MELIENVQPATLGAIVSNLWGFGMLIHACVYTHKGAGFIMAGLGSLFWPIITPLWLITWPARALWRRLGKRKVEEQEQEPAAVSGYKASAPISAGGVVYLQPDGTAAPIAPLRISAQDGPFAPAPTVQAAMETYRRLRIDLPPIEAKTPDKPAPYAPQGHGSKPERPWVTREEWLESVRAAGAELGRLTREDIAALEDRLSARLDALEGKGAWRGWVHSDGKEYHIVTPLKEVYFVSHEFDGWEKSSMTVGGLVATQSKVELHGPELAALVREFEAWRDSKPELP